MPKFYHPGIPLLHELCKAVLLPASGKYMPTTQLMLTISTETLSVCSSSVMGIAFVLMAPMAWVSWAECDTPLQEATQNQYGSSCQGFLSRCTTQA